MPNSNNLSLSILKWKHGKIRAISLKARFTYLNLLFWKSNLHLQKGDYDMRKYWSYKKSRRVSVLIVCLIFVVVALLCFCNCKSQVSKKKILVPPMFESSVNIVKNRRLWLSNKGRATPSNGENIGGKEKKGGRENEVKWRSLDHPTSP